MFERLLSIFRKKKEEPVAPPQPKDQIIVSFIFVNDKVEILTNWSDMTEYQATVLGQLLFLINEGQFTENIVNLLSEYGRTDTKIQWFVQKVLKAWSDAKSHSTENEEEDENPIVEPDKFLAVQVDEKDE